MTWFESFGGAQMFANLVDRLAYYPRRGMYGHGFNLGRITVDVRVDGRVIFGADVGTPSHWRMISFEIPGGIGTSTVAVAVRASDRIESTWSWGRSSTVIVKNFVIVPDQAGTIEGVRRKDRKSGAVTPRKRERIPKGLQVRRKRRDRDSQRSAKTFNPR